MSPLLQRCSTMVWGLLLALVLRAAPAGAQPATPPSADELRRQGAAAAAARDYEKCVERYSAALEKERLASTAGELGLCEEALGRNIAAHDHLLEAIAGEIPAAPPPAPAMWRRYRQAAERVDRKVARVLLLVSPSMATVFLDGQPLGSQVSGRAFAVLPGEHTWTAKLPGFADATVTHTARAGDFPDIGLFIPGWPPAPAPSRPPEATTPLARAPVPAPPATPEPRGAERGARLPSKTCRALGALLWRNMDPSLVLIGGALLSAGFTADVGPGFFVGGEAHFSRKEDWGFSVGADVRVVLPTKGGIRQDNKPLDVSLIAIAVAPCARYRWVMGCVFADPGLAIGGGPPKVVWYVDPVLFMFGVGPRLAVDLPIVERVGLRAFADLRFSPLRSDLGFLIHEVPIWTHSPVSGFFGLGVTLG